MHYFKSKQTNVETKHLWSNLSRTYYHNGERTKLRGGEQRRQKKKANKKPDVFMYKERKSKNGTIKNIDGFRNQNK